MNTLLSRGTAGAAYSVADMENPLAHTISDPPVDLPAHDQLVLYPTFGHLSSDGRMWHVGVSGVVFESGNPNNLRRKMFTRVLQQLLKVPSSELQSAVFQRRVDQFLVTTQRGKRLAVEVGSTTHRLQRPSKRNGHFRGSFRLTLDEARQLSRASVYDNHWLDFRVAADFGQPVQADWGCAQLIGQSGVTVISDIDDTIKRSEVANRRRLLRNTFLNEFEPVPGMAGVFRGWASQGAAFHYVSSSPWQLYGCLKELVDGAGFPQGSFHLRAIRLRDASVLRLFVARRATKRRIIRSIVRMFPFRQFVLVGDSGEKDPEIYGSIARQFPRQVKRINIRLVEGRKARPERFRRAFRDLDASRYRIFDHPDQLLGHPLIE
jgi:phosphatidate phosphatase APP1